MGLFDRFKQKEIALPKGYWSARIYTYDDRRLPDMKEGETLVVEYVPKTVKLKSIYTGTETESDCAFAYKGKPFACTLRDDIRGLFKALSKHGKVTCWIHSSGRAEGGWLELHLMLPRKKDITELLISLEQ